MSISINMELEFLGTCKFIYANEPRIAYQFFMGKAARALVASQEYPMMMSICSACVSHFRII